LRWGTNLYRPNARQNHPLITLNPGIFDQVQQLLGSASAEEAEAHVARLEDEIQAKKAEQQKWWALLGLKQQLGEAERSTNGPSEFAGYPAAACRCVPLRRAVRVIFEERTEGSTVVLADLRDELLRRNWLSDDEKDIECLYMTGSNMVKRDELSRPRRGLYQLPSAGDGPRGWDREQSGEVGSR
jgi:hypothetical protein